MIDNPRDFSFNNTKSYIYNAWIYSSSVLSSGYAIMSRLPRSLRSLAMTPLNHRHCERSEAIYLLYNAALSGRPKGIRSSGLVLPQRSEGNQTRVRSAPRSLRAKRGENAWIYSLSVRSDGYVQDI
jgi:hypothetical protein